MTTKDEICVAIGRQLGNKDAIAVSSVKSVRKAYGGTLTAALGLNAEIAKKVASARKVEIG